MRSLQVHTFINELDSELKDAILPFWMTRMVDDQHGGFYGRIDGEGHIHPESPKGSVLNARILWTFSAAYNHYGETKYLDLANRAFEYCIEHFINHQNQGVYWMVDYQGFPYETKNQIYALSFMIYGLSEYFKSTKNPSALDYCIELFKSIEKHSFDPKQNGYYEAFDQHWILLKDLRLSEKDANEKKTMNTHLHILEAYTNLYRIWKNKQLKNQLINLVRLFVDKIIDPNTSHFYLFFDEEWNPRDKEISFGHDIEGSWLIQEAAEVSGNEELIAISRKLALQMVNAVLNQGYDEDGGLYYELKTDGVFDTDKHWWPQAEAMVGLINAYQISQKSAYLDQAFKQWEFIKKNLIDTRSGEWYFRVNKERTPYLTEDMAGIWKCPYHNSRACLEIIWRLG